MSQSYHYYDEAGNRTRKKVYNVENDSLLKDIVYSRDVSGKEMAIYENESIKQWNIWGTDNAGFINANGDKRYYLKDHLGSIRAVIDDGGSLVSVQDYDVWGYQLQDRSYNSEEVIYKYTSKERDNENKYDYIGARYYDARVGRWGSVEPLYNKYIDISPYSFVAGNPLVFRDKDGKDIIVTGDDAKKVVKELRNSTNLKYKFDITSGRLTISGVAETKIEELLLEASKSEKITVNLTTTRSNNPEYWIVGAFYGSSMENNKIVASQSFNLKFAKVWEQAGGSSVGLSAAHEIVEAFIGGVYFPGEKIRSSDEPNYGWSHFLTVLAEGAEGNAQYYHGLAKNPATLEYFFVNDKGKEKIYYPIK